MEQDRSDRRDVLAGALAAAAAGLAPIPAVAASPVSRFGADPFKLLGSFITIWDDHEVANDYAGTTPEYRDERNFIVRRAAYRAYFENLPLRLSELPREAQGGRRIYRRFVFGDLLALHMLDTRQYRSPQPCPWGSKRGIQLVSELDCPDLTRPDRRMLGLHQSRWLERGVSRSLQRWNVIASGVPFAVLDARKDRRTLANAIGSGGDRPQISTDGWSGYLIDRQRIVDLLARNRARNPVIISGDLHNYFVNRIYPDWRKPGAGDPVAPEIVSGAISSRVFG